MNKTIGVVSDTHGMVEPKLFTLFDRVDFIIHAGDIGAGVITELETIAPVIAVKGNMDNFITEKKLHEFEIVEIASKKILITHVFGFPRRITSQQKQLIEKESPDVIIFGHTHSSLNKIENGILYLNPGSAGPARFSFRRSVAILIVGHTTLTASIIPLD